MLEPQPIITTNIELLLEVKWNLMGKLERSSRLFLLLHDFTIFSSLLFFPRIQTVCIYDVIIYLWEGLRINPIRWKATFHFQFYIHSEGNQTSSNILHVQNHWFYVVYLKMMVMWSRVVVIVFNIYIECCCWMWTCSSFTRSFWAENIVGLRTPLSLLFCRWKFVSRKSGAKENRRRQRKKLIHFGDY